MRAALCSLVLALAALLSPAHAMAADGGVCPRLEPGQKVLPPPDLFSRDGVLKVAFNYYTSVDDAGRTLFCFVTPDGAQSPTLHVKPGDRIEMTVTNLVPPVPGGPVETISNAKNVCGDGDMTLASVNVHFHGVNASPGCHSDETIHTLINPGKSFDYVVKIPNDEPPGLYWYHPHVHGVSSAAVEGGASGAIEVEGIENIQPAVAGLPQRYLILRDMPLMAAPRAEGALPPQNPRPFWDLSINYVPVNFPFYKPARIRMQPGKKEFWRVVNASANSIFDIQLTYDGAQQPLDIVALDGVPTGSQDGRRQGVIVTKRDILIPPAGRAEFIVKGPSKDVKAAQLSTLAIDTGPLGDSLPARPIADIELTAEPLGLPPAMAAKNLRADRFAGLDTMKPTATRRLYFSETFSHAADGKTRAPSGAGVKFYITVKGQDPRLFDPNEPPAIVTRKGTVEDWIIQNHSPEVHEFHIHQIHFMLLAVNGVPVPPEQRQFYDTYQVGYWDETGPYPSIKVRMDFRGAVVGDFVYHCHILQHEDGGMMAIIRVKPPKGRGK
ncbi:MAG TPA: multicopper oxidase domain-containing protein [Rhizomicrobium sp.]|nr:multicopper oxidase domain-containing protein [Rhizomicrobium sp.]